MFCYHNNTTPGLDVFRLGRLFSSRLQDFLSPFLAVLDQLLDKRLVATFAGLCASIIRHRSRSTGLYLSELGGYLLGFDKAPAGTKRISNLLRSNKWSYSAIADYLAEQGQQYVDSLLAKQEQVLLLWDESVQEKTESIQSEGLCAVGSSKAKRLLRIKPGYYDPPTKKPVHVPGIRWVGLLLCGLKEQPQIASFKWWTSRGKNATKLERVRFQLLQWAREQFSTAVLHVFDRGYAGAKWLGLLLAKDDRFLLRWPSGYKLLDQQGRLKRASLFSVGKKPTSSKEVWDMHNRPLESVYCIIWLDGIVFKVRENSRVVDKTIFIAIGLRTNGKKEVLGLWLGKNESASFWLSVLTDMKARGVQDVLITATDNGTGRPAQRLY